MSVSGGLAARAADHELTLFTEKPAQVIEGFGASGAWWAQHVGRWTPEQRAPILRLLFSAKAGIGLSIYRYNIGAGGGREIRDPWRRTDGFEIAPETYDWSRDAAAVTVLREICALGVSNITFFANSPPPRMTRNGLVSGGDGGRSNLRPDMVDAYARHLVDILRHFVRVEGLPVTALSPVNEPQWDWGDTRRQEGCHYEPEEAAAVVKAVLRELKAGELDVRVCAVESGAWAGGRSMDYARALFRDPEIAAGLDGLALHAYWSKAEDRRTVASAFRKEWPDKRIRMTEWCQMETGRRMDMTSALVLARTVHEDLVLGGVSAWVHWLAVSRYEYADGLVYIDERLRTFALPKRLSALGQYSRFVQPGSTRIETSCSHPDLLASAFLAPGRHYLTAVVVNPSAEPAACRLRADPGFQARILGVYQTTEERSLEQIHAGAVPVDPVTFAPQSVTTLVWPAAR